MLLNSTNVKLNWKAQNFELLSTCNSYLNYFNIKKKNGTVIVFLCNHCPYVQDIIIRMVEDFTFLKKLDFGLAAIMSNDTAAYPEDSFVKMQQFSKKYAFTFPYLIDETQEVARKYGAVCTPDFFCFDKKDKLFYRGRLDNLKYMENSNRNRRAELKLACEEKLKTGNVITNQISSMGCSIKWRSKE